MKQGLTLQEMAAELARRSLAKQDCVADTRKMEMVVDSGLPQLKIGDGPVSSVNTSPVNEIAHRQIATRLDIPAKYYDRMRAETPELLASNVNHWFQTQPEKRLVRMLDGRVRAFLSDRYQRIENEQIANTMCAISNCTWPTKRSTRSSLTSRPSNRANWSSPRKPERPPRRRGCVLNKLLIIAALLPLKAYAEDGLLVSDTATESLNRHIEMRIEEQGALPMGGAPLGGYTDEKFGDSAPPDTPKPGYAEPTGQPDPFSVGY